MGILKRISEDVFFNESHGVTPIESIDNIEIDFEQYSGTLDIADGYYAEICKCHPNKKITTILEVISQEVTSIHLKEPMKIT